MPGLSARYPSTGQTPRGVSSVEVARHEPLIGRKVMMRWPADNNFYEAIITDYDPQKVRLRLGEIFVSP